MKKHLKIVLLSFVVVVVLNVILFAVLTIFQAPYYDEAPSQVESIYELYASDTYNKVIYRGSLGFISDDKEIQEIENALKSTPLNKMNKIDSYLKMLSLDGKNFALLTLSNYNQDNIDEEKIVASSILIYSENNNIYVVCLELTGYETKTINDRMVVYETNNIELSKLLDKYKSSDKNGFNLVVPDWKYDISNFPENSDGKLYVLSFVVEFVLVLFLTNKFFAKKQPKHQINTEDGSLCSQ